MTAPTSASPPPLVRRPDDRVVRGVCAAIGRTTGTDPVLWRVVLVVLAIFGGSGLLIYVAGWLLIPEEGAEASIAERHLRGRGLSRTAVIALTVVGATVLGLTTGGSGDAAPVLAAGLLAYIVLRGLPTGQVVLGQPPGTSYGKTAYPPTGGSVAGGGSGGSSGSDAGGGSVAGSPDTVPVTAAAPPGARWSPPAPRPRSALGLLTVSAALLVVGVLLGLQAANRIDLTVGGVLAAALATVGVGLLVGARWGRSRGLVLLAALLAATLGITTGAHAPVDLSAGQRTWLVQGSDFHSLGLGDAVLDLRPLGSAPQPGTDVTARVGAGNLRLVLPAGLHVEVTARVSAGQIVLPGEPVPVEGTELRVVRVYGPDDAPLVHVDARVGAGQLEVRRDAS